MLLIVPLFIGRLFQSGNGAVSLVEVVQRAPFVAILEHAAGTTLQVVQVLALATYNYPPLQHVVKNVPGITVGIYTGRAVGIV